MFAKQLDLIRERCADRHAFKKIEYPQKIAYAHFRGFRPVVQDLAACLLVLVKWDYARFCEFQGAIADIVSDICRPINARTKEPIRYTDRQIRGALKTLEDSGFVSIPRTVSREEKLAKVYRFTPAFFALVHESPVKMCDKDLLRPSRALFECTKPDRVTENQDSGFNTKQSRAIDQTSRVNVSNMSHGDAQPKKAVYSRTTLSRDLSPVLRQIVHWLSGCSMLSGQREAITLCGAFLEFQSDEQIAQWVDNWPAMISAERSFTVRQIVGYLRSLSPAVFSADSTYSPESIDEPTHTPAFNIDRFRAALLSGKPYDGPGKGFIDRFRAADEFNKELMLLDLQTKIKTGSFIFDD